MKNIRLNYLNGLEWKCFTTKKAFLEWASNPKNNGFYYVSYSYMTNKYNREQVLSIFKK